MLSFIGKFPLPPLPALPQLFFFKPFTSDLASPPPHPTPPATHIHPYPSPILGFPLRGFSLRLPWFALGFLGGVLRPCWGGGDKGGTRAHRGGGCRGGGCPGAAGGCPHLSDFLRCSGHGLQREGGRGSIQTHPNPAPLSHTPRSRLRAHPGSGYPRQPHVLGLGRGNGTAWSWQAVGLRSEKAIFRGGSSGGTEHWLRAYALVLELVFKEKAGRIRIPAAPAGHGRREGGCAESLPALGARWPHVSVCPP